MRNAALIGVAVVALGFALASPGGKCPAAPAPHRFQRDTHVVLVTKSPRLTRALILWLRNEEFWEEVLHRREEMEFLKDRCHDEDPETWVRSKLVLRPQENGLRLRMCDCSWEDGAAVLRVITRQLTRKRTPEEVHDATAALAVARAQKAYLIQTWEGTQDDVDSLKKLEEMELDAELDLSPPTVLR
jgi:hypothetical protein